MMTGFFITGLKKMYTGIFMEIDSLGDKLNRIKIEKDINDFVEKIKQMQNLIKLYSLFLISQLLIQ